MSETTNGIGAVADGPQTNAASSGNDENVGPALKADFYSEETDSVVGQPIDLTAYFSYTEGGEPPGGIAITYVISKGADRKPLGAGTFDPGPMATTDAEGKIEMKFIPTAPGPYRIGLIVDGTLLTSRSGTVSKEADAAALPHHTDEDGYEDVTDKLESLEVHEPTNLGLESLDAQQPETVALPGPGFHHADAFGDEPGADEITQVNKRPRTESAAAMPRAPQTPQAETLHVQEEDRRIHGGDIVTPNDLRPTRAARTLAEKPLAVVIAATVACIMVIFGALLIGGHVPGPASAAPSLAQPTVIAAPVMGAEIDRTVDCSGRMPDENGTITCPIVKN